MFTPSGTIGIIILQHPHHGASRPPIGGNVETQPIVHRGTLVQCMIDNILAWFARILILTSPICMCHKAWFCVTFMTSSPPHISAAISSPVAIVADPMATECVQIHCVHAWLICSIVGGHRSRWKVLVVAIRSQYHMICISYAHHSIPSSGHGYCNHNNWWIWTSGRMIITNNLYLTIL